MATLFFDSSALVKRYVQETGSEWIRALCDVAADNAQYVVQITLVETVSAIIRRRRRGELTADDSEAAISTVRLHFADEYMTVGVSLPLIERAADLAHHYGLRAYDAVQLAALRTQVGRDARGLPPLTFLSADNALNVAARAEGLTVDNPNDHP